jgi:hypothetical protein
MLYGQSGKSTAVPVATVTAVTGVCGYTVSSNSSVKEIIDSASNEIATAQ